MELYPARLHKGRDEWGGGQNKIRKESLKRENYAKMQG